ncbi:hypothetical protein HYPSUDRAFT_919639 [Hypholoma sublateritium FD-334 SS-4]|uniref:Uncharacterized protein n=1 Tax=Hypholoma sublateritium (strain FD-334 SS-4) TaxID=945553 RepID=A0A0D2M697_HYPSF|nr:hypothetical protein HYPSUDRAFT_919639 [Hypholoma sublateritium FD-334 SS-4]
MLNYLPVSSSPFYRPRDREGERPWVECTHSLLWCAHILLDTYPRSAEYLHQTRRRAVDIGLALSLAMDDMRDAGRNSCPDYRCCSQSQYSVPAPSTAHMHRPPLRADVRSARRIHCRQRLQGAQRVHFLRPSSSPLSFLDGERPPKGATRGTILIGVCIAHVHGLLKQWRCLFLYRIRSDLHICDFSLLHPRLLLLLLRR